MRIKNTIKNSIYAVVSYVILAILTLIVRKVFVNTLSVEYLGYEGLFGNVFALLALSDLGIETTILYRLFPAFAKEDTGTINQIMSIYRKLYRYVGILISGLGLALIPFLPWMVSDQSLKWRYIYGIYLMQLGGTLCTYFLAYKRLMFSVSQQEYECTKTDTVISFGCNLVKVTVLLVFRSYMMYLFCGLIAGILGNLIISQKVHRRFPEYEDRQKVTLKVIHDIGLGKDIKNNLLQKFSVTVYGSTDNILTSVLLGIGQVGLLANYLLIQGVVTAFFTRLLRPFQMSIGNYIYTTDQEQGYRQFRMFDFISFFIASVIAGCYLSVFNPFITLWLGQDYVLNDAFVMALAMNQYVMWNHQFLCFYRSSFGRYELDRVPMMSAALINIVTSILFCRLYGIVGIMMGTVIGHFGIWIGRIRVVYQEYIKENVFKYVLRQVKRFILFLFEMVVIYLVFDRLPITIIGILFRIIFCMILTGFCNILFFWNSMEWKEAKSYIGKIIKIMNQKDY